MAINFAHLQYFWTVAREGSVAGAARALHVTPQTVSGQIKLLEERLGAPLLERQGRRVVLTETGKVAARYAEEIFTLGAELAEVLRGRRPGGPMSFTVGVADVVPKQLAYRLLAPCLSLEQPVHLVCLEGPLEELLGELALHRLDMVLADSPVPAGVDVRAFAHALGESGITFLGPRQLVERLQTGFPASLDDAPMLLPVRPNALRQQLDRWFDDIGVMPRVVAEFEDSALLKAFGQGGTGLLPVASTIAAELMAQLGLERLGATDAVREAVYAISVERRIRHPAVLAVTERARTQLFSNATEDGSACP